jgi:hypothetical protein
MFNFGLWRKSLKDLHDEIGSKGLNVSVKVVKTEVKKHLNTVKKSQHLLGEISMLYMEYSKKLHRIAEEGEKGILFTGKFEDAEAIQSAVKTMLLEGQQIIFSIEALTRRLEITEKKEE